MTDAEHVFILVLTDEEIALIRKASLLTGKKFSNICHDFLIEEAERTIEDAEMLQEMANRDMKRTVKAYDDDDRSEKDALWGCDNRTYFM